MLGDRGNLWAMRLLPFAAAVVSVVGQFERTFNPR
jgi:hypothetical protein